MNYLDQAAWERVVAARTEKSAAARIARLTRYQGTCEHCGGPTSGIRSGIAREPKRCLACSRKHSAIWTEEAIIAAIQLYAHRYGHPPYAQHWNPQMARTNGRDDLADRFYADGDYPNTTVVQHRFGSWNKAITAAGFQARGVGQRGKQTAMRKARANLRGDKA